MALGIPQVRGRSVGCCRSGQACKAGRDGASHCRVRQLAWLCGGLQPLEAAGLRAGLLPHPVLNPLPFPFLQADASAAALKQQIALGRVGAPEEAAGAMLMLASPYSSYVSGQALEVTGGGWL